jgi:hypothetical protein
LNSKIHQTDDHCFPDLHENSFGTSDTNLRDCFLCNGVPLMASSGWGSEVSVSNASVVAFSEEVSLLSLQVAAATFDYRAFACSPAHGGDWASESNIGLPGV